MVVAVTIWVGALGGAHLPAIAGLLVVTAGLVLAGAMQQPRVALVVVLGIGLFSGNVAAQRVESTLGAELPQGRGVVLGLALTDPDPYGDRHRFVIQPDRWEADGWQAIWSGPPLVVVTESAAVTAGDRVRVVGLLRRAPHLVRGDAVAGRLVATQVDVVATTDSVVMRVGNLVRDRVRTQLVVLSGSPEAALLAGFLIGDIAALPRADNESLRRAGLTHYVAVSGSNVALVLAAWWLVLGPTGAGARLRAATALVVLAVFVVATRWESSVIRAATMAGLVLGGRAAGVPVDAWMALGGAISILIAVSGDLAYNVGFQLSVAATAGVLLGFRIFGDRRPRVLWGALATTVSAQMAVVPLLLVHFGTIPLLSPVANLLAAPLVTVATALAGAGVMVGWEAPLRLAEWCAGLVLAVARVAGEWPQLDVTATLGVAGVLAAVWRTPLRGAVVAGGIGLALLAAVPPGPPDVPTMVFLDVGQGDAVLLRDPTGAVALVDGGRDSAVLAAGLRRHGVGSLDLVVATHGDADHVGGLAGLFSDIEVEHLWVADHMEAGDLLDQVVAEAADSGTVVSAVSAGSSAHLGDYVIEVLSPMRRYAGGNDGSVVLWVTVRDKTVLLPGDIGATAQRELPALHPDLMLVPHHGSATTDLGWLATTLGDWAVISVGVNTYGHPDPGVMATLNEEGVAPLLTRDHGDIEVPFG